MSWWSGDKPKKSNGRKAAGRKSASRGQKTNGRSAGGQASNRKPAAQSRNKTNKSKRTSSLRADQNRSVKGRGKTGAARRTTSETRGQKRGGVGSNRGPVYFLFYWGTVAALWSVVLFAGLLLFYSVTMPDPQIAGLNKRGQAIRVLANDGSLIAERGITKNYVRIEHLPDHVKQAVIAIEDRRFYTHLGFDPIGFTRAMLSNLKARRLVQGGSTISQQLAKNLFLSSDRTVTRKIKEMGLAFWLEYKLDKDEILELYLNRVYLGQKAYGVDQAARRYFGKRAKSLSLSEAAMLAGLLKAPSRLNPKRNYKAAKKRASLVLNAMHRDGYITALTKKLANLSPAKLGKRQLPINSNYIVDWIADLVPEYATDFKSDLIIETSIDKGLQLKANERVKAYLKKDGRRRHVSQASMVVLSADGAVRAMVGGRDYQVSQFNRAISSRRQTGSAFKPFVYLAALEAGFQPSSLVYDAPTKFNKWRPRNYKDKYLGQISLQSALAHSSNVVAVKLMGTVGVAKTIETAHRMGLRGRFKKDLSLALGTAEQSLLELSAAYAPFANGGRGVLPYVIKRIRTAKGKILFQHRKSDLGQVVHSSHVNQMNQMMRSVVRSGTGRAARLTGHDHAGKTGTTQNFKDGWFVGYSARYIGGVWVGNDNGRPMKKVTGGGLPAQIWSDVMSYAHKDLEPRRLYASSTEAVVMNSWKDVGMTRRIRPQFFEKVLK